LHAGRCRKLKGINQGWIDLCVITYSNHNNISS
jgi:hypothetical protein